MEYQLRFKNGDYSYIVYNSGGNGNSRAYPGQFGISGEANAKIASLRPCYALLLAQIFIIGSSRRSFQTFNKSGLVPDDSGSDAIWKLLRPHQIATAYLKRVDAERPGSHVHQAFGDEGGNRPADAAIRPGRRLVGRYPPHGAAVRSDFVGAGKKTDDLHGFEPARPGIDRIGADIADHVGFQRDSYPVLIETHFSIDDFGECLAGAADVFQTIRRPFKRTAQLSCRHAQEDFFGIKRALGAKAPAHIRRHHTQPAAGQIERFRERIAHNAGYVG